MRADREQVVGHEDRLHWQHHGVCHGSHGVGLPACQCRIGRPGTHSCCEPHRESVMDRPHGALPNLLHLQHYLLVCRRQEQAGMLLAHAKLGSGSSCGLCASTLH